MNARTSLQARVEQYLAERRHMGFKLRSTAYSLDNFARYVAHVKHRGPLNVELMAEWARQTKAGQGTRATSARRLRQLRPFARWLQRFDLATEVPSEAIFGSVPGRVAPHIYRENEIIDLLAAAKRLGPSGDLRAAVYETLFGLLASTGLRISEARSLLDSDVDLKSGVLTIRQSKFGKSRLVPMHPSTTQALARYRALRCSRFCTMPQTPFFIGTRGRLLGGLLGDRQVHRIFEQLRGQLGWVDRGCHGAPRIHDLRHTFAVNRLMLWHQQGFDLDQRMLALSTYLGHARVSDTYWYLTGVPDLMALAGSRFERYVNPMEVNDE